MARRSGRGRRSGRRHGRQVPLRLLPLLPLLPLASACKLTEVTVAPGQRVVVVQSVLQLRYARSGIAEPGLEQTVVVEYSQTGDTPDSSDRRIPPGDPAQPITNALVTIENLGGSFCAGRVDTLIESPSEHAGRTGSGVYQRYFGYCIPRAGDRLRLRVETPAGEVVTGELTTPGALANEIAVGSQPGSGTAWILNRERDTMRIAVTPVTGRALQLEARPTTHLDHLAFFTLTDTMGITLPGNLVNPFEGDSGESVFRAGRYYDLAVALTDSNYYDYLRSRSDPFTGRGFINHLTGGIGVFGAVEATDYYLRVVAPVDDPREGVYHLSGQLDGGPVDITLELYLDEVQRDQFSAFVTYAGPGGEFPYLSGDGFFTGDGSGMDFEFWVPGHVPQDSATYRVNGVRQAGGVPFPVTLLRIGSAPGNPDTLTAQQMSGPSGSARR